MTSICTHVHRQDLHACVHQHPTQRYIRYHLTPSLNSIHFFPIKKVDANASLYFPASVTSCALPCVPSGHTDFNALPSAWDSVSLKSRDLLSHHFRSLLRCVFLWNILSGHHIESCLSFFSSAFSPASTALSNSTLQSSTLQPSTLQPTTTI